MLTQLHNTVACACVCVRVYVLTLRCFSHGTARHGRDCLCRVGLLLEDANPDCLGHTARFLPCAWHPLHHGCTHTHTRKHARTCTRTRTRTRPTHTHARVPTHTRARARARTWSTVHLHAVPVCLNALPVHVFCTRVHTHTHSYMHNIIFVLASRVVSSSALRMLLTVRFNSSVWCPRSTRRGHPPMTGLRWR